MVDFRCQQSVDRATQGCDLSASWLPRGRCHTVSLFSVACGQKRYRWRAPEEHAINPGVKGELDKITVYARHVFYDLLDNMIKSYKPSPSAVGASVVQTVSSSCLSEHDFTFYSDLDSTAEDVEFENINPVDAILGEEGVVEKYGGELTRDWWDVFVVKRVGQDSNVPIRQAKNLLGMRNL